MKNKLKKALALLLSVLMVSSEFTGLITPAQALSTAFATPPTVYDGTKDNFAAAKNGRPNLFVSFLGDNSTYNPNGAGVVNSDGLSTPATYDYESTTNPTSGMWTKYAQNDELVSNSIDSTNGRVFWVGVGVDRVELLKLLEGNDGLTSFEAGFYYDSDVVEPYTGSDYKQLITDYNLGSAPSSNRWDSSIYTVLRAETDLPVQTDELTQEELTKPSMTQITNSANMYGTWRMTYVSIELKDVETTSGIRRLSEDDSGFGSYKTIDDLTDPTTGDVNVPDSASGATGYEYLLMIPFRLKKYDVSNGVDWSHIRLVRNATHFSAGGGTYGVDPYGAWERITTRNDTASLKLMTNFTGDLKLFDSGKADEVRYKAKLEIRNGGGSQNKAKLSVDGDPAIWPVYASANGEIINNLSSGLGMKVEVAVQTGYKVEVTVRHKATAAEQATAAPGDIDSDGYIWWDYTKLYTPQNTAGDQRLYTFTMPELDDPNEEVIVRVQFIYVERDQFRLYLSEIHQQEDPANPGSYIADSTRKVGNMATITVNQMEDAANPGAAPINTADSASINSYDPVYSPHPNSSHTVTDPTGSVVMVNHDDGPSIEAKPFDASTATGYVTITVETHNDYEAVVQFYDFRTAGQAYDGSFSVFYNGIPGTLGTDYTIDYTTATLVLPSGGTFSIPMQENDLDIEITYRPAKRQKATLEVFHDTANSAEADYEWNTAQLVHTTYDDFNAAQRAYSSVVFEDINQTETTPYNKNRHRAVKSGGKVLPWISADEAILSGSLGGDTGVSGKAWSLTLSGTTVPDADLTRGRNAVTTLLYSAASASDLASKLTALDVGQVELNPGAASNLLLTGLRKDLQGSSYEQNDLSALADYLWEIRELVKNDSSYSAYIKTPTQSDGATPAYTYLDLTPAQIQHYLLQCFTADYLQRENQQAYRLILQEYQTLDAWYTSLAGDAAYDDAAAPVAPIAPGGVVLPDGATTFARSYQDKDYQTAYVADYRTYLTAYKSYKAQVEAANGAHDASGALIAHPAQTGIAAVPAMKTVEIASPTDAWGAVTGTSGSFWEFPAVSGAADACTIETRQGRAVYVALEADSRYEVASITLYDADGVNPLTDASGNVLTASQVTGYQNIYSFEMPSVPCVVRVTYQKRRAITVNVEIKGTDSKKNNLSQAEIYTSYEGSSPAHATTPKYNAVGNYTSGGDLAKTPVHYALVGSTVTVTVQKHEGYKATVTALTSTSSAVLINSTTAADGTETHTFKIPNITGSVDITIEYEEIDKNRNNAIIRFSSLDTYSDDFNDAYWRDGSGGHVAIKANVPEGEPLVADINVYPGFYIYSITAHGASGTYSFTYTGNGYNGGYGAVDPSQIVLNTTMPGETYYVDVVFAKGIPDPPPKQTLTLTVQDDDNDNADGSGYVKNWAKAEVYDVALPVPADVSDPANPGSATLEQNLPTLSSYPGDVLGKNPSYGNNNLQDTQYVSSGKWVRIEFDAQVVMQTADPTEVDYSRSYYVSSITVSPSGLGVTLNWESPNVVSFYMPADSCGVTVKFEQYPETGLPTYKLQVREDYRVPSADAALMDKDADTGLLLDSISYITTADSTTIRTWHSGGAYPLFPTQNYEQVPPSGSSGATGAAKAGETVTMTYTVDTSKYYVHSIALLYPGATNYLPLPATPTSTSGTVETYAVSFVMPSDDAEFVVQYRKGPAPAEKDYTFMLCVIDQDNIGITQPDGTVLYDQNWVTASFTSTVTPAPTSTVAGWPQTSDPSRYIVATQNVYAGDKVNLNVHLDTGYSLEYLVITPYSMALYPAWSDANNASFTMPAGNVTVIAKIVKQPAKEYIVNLILRPPGSDNIEKVGQGSLVLPAGSGSIASYHDNAIFSTVATPGTTYGLDLYAFPGYYIDRITIDPAVGASATYTGNVGYQTGEFVMPRANINVNVWFKKGWPAEIPYDMTLNVYDVTADGAHNPDNYACFDSAASTPFTAPDSDKVYGNESRTVEDKVKDNDVVIVRVNKTSGYIWDAVITDRAGNTVSWWRVPGGFAFTAPPSHVTIDVTFRKSAPVNTYTATLHISGASAGDSATLTAITGALSGSPVSTDGGVISNLEAGDVLNLDVLLADSANRHISAVYAYVDGSGTTVPVYLLRSGDIYSDCLSYASFPPHGLNAGEKGQLAMPEGNIHVFVKFAEGKVSANDLPLTLWVSGKNGSGSAKADIEETTTNPDISSVVATGMDTVFTQSGNTVTVTFNPASGYTIAKLEVYRPDGTPIDYEWISMVIDPAYLNSDGTLKDPAVWPVPPSDPTMSTPNYVKNDQLQITFQMPAVSGAIVHVTYEKADTTPYKIQVVVNDDAFVESVPSQNDAYMYGDTTTTPPSGKTYIRYETAGTPVDLVITVHPGYYVKSILAVPQGYGIHPNLPLGNRYSQTTAVTMPAGDIVVYVEFARDEAPWKNATLVVTDNPKNSMSGTSGDKNYATISSPISGTSSQVHINWTPQSVLARPTTDWVEVNYYWDTATSSVEKVTVTDISGSVNIPFTQVFTGEADHGKIILPMYSDDIVVTVVYRKDPNPVTYDVNLHVIDEDGTEVYVSPIESTGVEAGWGRLNYDSVTIAGGTPSSTPSTPSPTLSTPNGIPAIAQRTATPDGNTAQIQVPAGEKVTLSAFSGATAAGAQVYVKSAVVIYRATGQVIHCNLRNASGAEVSTGLTSDTFTVHPGVNDVYVRLTTKEVREGEHSAILMLQGPESNCGQASITNRSRTPAPAIDDELLQANSGYAYTTATDGEHISIEVIPAPGYVIDYVQITPLGFPLDTAPEYNWVRSGNSITFDMPHINVGILAVLKRGVSNEYTATLHFRQDTGTEDTRDKANLFWTPAGATTATTITANYSTSPDPSMKVSEGATVTLEGFVYGSDVILSAYVLRSGALVPLTPSYPTTATPSSGLEGVGQLRSDTTGEADGVATFTMPAEDVDVYLIVTNDPPTRPWHTVVLITTDQRGTTINSGDNLGELWETDDTATAHKEARSFGNPGHVSLALTEKKADNVTDNTFSAKPVPAAGYEFQLPATATYNKAPYSANLTPKSFSPYVYRENVGTCNTAVLMHFVAADKQKLTVVIEDRENPSDGSTTNAVDVKPDSGSPADLHLESTTSFGAYQIMTDVTGGDTMNVVVTPHDGFKAYATLTTPNADGTSTVTRVSLTWNSVSGTYTGSFNMPPSDATLTVTFTQGYTGTLELVNNTSSGHQGSMHDTVHHTDASPNQVNVTTVISPNSDRLTDLPNGDGLVARMEKTEGEKPYRLTALLTERGYTTLMSVTTDADGLPSVSHTIDRADAKITFVLNETTGTDYVAAVELVNAPAGANASIATSTAGLPGGSIWTVAKAADTVTTTVTVPDGYRAELTARDSAGNTVAINPVNMSDGANQTATITMPAADVQITITFVRTKFDLKLVVIDDTTASGNTASVTGGDVALSYGGTTGTLATPGNTITITAATDTAVSGIRISRVYYRADDGTFHQWTLGDNDTVFPDTGVSNTFLMPSSDTTVYVVFSPQRVPSSGTPAPGAEDYYLAYTATAYDSAAPYHADNRVTSIQNLSRTTKLGSADPLPQSSPAWTAIYDEDSVRVSYQVADGYYAVVTARYDLDNSPLPVSQAGYTGIGYAQVKVPDALKNNVKITVTFYKGVVDTTTAYPAALRLVEHDREGDNAATLTDVTASPSLTITLDGSNSGFCVDSADLSSDIEQSGNSVYISDDLRVIASWGTGYQVTRITLAIRDISTGEDLKNPTPKETPEIDLPMAKYGSTVTARCDVPLLSADEKPIIRVYYGSIFEATLHIERGGTTGDTTYATDDRASTVTSTGSSPIYNTGDKLIQMSGGETVETTACPSADQRLVGVVYESASLGAQSVAESSTAGQYDFTMPAEDVDFYVIYEDINTPPKDRQYIAKVRFTDQSEHVLSADNQVTIRNDSNPAAPGGAYWVAAKGTYTDPASGTTTVGDSVTVTVKVAAGFQAKITATIRDENYAGTTMPTHDQYDYYITRTIFVPNLPDGKDATFTMPVASDATVFVEYTKGYDLELEVKDTSALATTTDQNTVTVATNESPSRVLEWWNEDVAASAPVYGASGTVLHAVENGKTISTALTYAISAPDDPYVTSRVLRYSVLTGTETMLANGVSGDAVPNYTMPSANVLESVLFRSSNAQDKLLAKVQVKGETDITGNSATPIIDHKDSVDHDLSTTTGATWTTTAEGRYIDLTITVAKGYVAKIRVENDNAKAANPADSSLWYLDAADYKFERAYTASGVSNLEDLSDRTVSGITEVEIGYDDTVDGSAFPGSVSGEQHFRFYMPKTGDPYAPTDVTVVVEFIYAGTIPQPYDPAHTAANNQLPSFLEEGFIYGENRGDFAVIDIPTLMKDSKLYDTDNHDELATLSGSAKDASKNVTFQFYLRKVDAAGSESYIPLTAGTDVDLVVYDEDALRAPGDPYNYYETAYDHSFSTAIPAEHTIGSKFLLVPHEDALGNLTANGQLYYDMLNDLENTPATDDYLGSLKKEADGTYKTQLYVIVQNAIGEQSAYTEVWIRPYFTLRMNVTSYGPMHPTFGTLYKLRDDPDLDPGEIDSYDTDHPIMEIYNVLDKEPNNYGEVWRFPLNFRSSDLLGGFDNNYNPDPATNQLLLGNVDSTANLTYAILAEKAANLPYTRVNLNLNPYTNGDFVPIGSTFVYPDYYGKDEPTTFRVQDTAWLFGGSVRGYDSIANSDLEFLEDFLSRGQKYTTYRDKASAPTSYDWYRSIYNPASYAYWCDLDSDGAISWHDYNILRSEFSWKRTTKSYLWTRVSDGAKVLPFGFGKDKNGGSYSFTLFSVEDFSQPCAMEMSAFWTALNETEEAAELPGIFVEADGTLLTDDQSQLWLAMKELEERLGDDTAEQSPSDAPTDGERHETPGDSTVVQPGDVEIALPDRLPDDLAALPEDPWVDVNLPEEDEED